MLKLLEKFLIWINPYDSMVVKDQKETIIRLQRELEENSKIIEMQHSIIMAFQEELAFYRH